MTLNSAKRRWPSGHGRFAILLGLLLLVVARVDATYGSWSTPGAGDGAARSRSLPAGNKPSVSLVGSSVTVSWTAATVGSTAITSYTVRRYSSTGVLQTIGASCSGTVSGLSCTETNVPTGSWTYTDTPKLQGSRWVGDESARSSTTAVANARRPAPPPVRRPTR